MTLEARLEEIERQSLEIEAQFGRPEVASDPDALRRLGREQARVGPVVEAYRRLRAVRIELAGARDVRDHEHDAEMRELAKAEVEHLETEEARLLEELKLLLVPRDPNDDRDVIVEIRAGTGGEEAALFAQQLFRMYKMYGERSR